MNTGDSSACADRRNYPSRSAALWTAGGETATSGTRRSSSAEPTRLECTTTTSTTLDVSTLDRTTRSLHATCQSAVHAQRRTSIIVSNKMLRLLPVQTTGG